MSSRWQDPSSYRGLLLARGGAGTKQHPVRGLHVPLTRARSQGHLHWYHDYLDDEHSPAGNYNAQNVVVRRAHLTGPTAQVGGGDQHGGVLHLGVHAQQPPDRGHRHPQRRRFRHPLRGRQRGHPSARRLDRDRATALLLVQGRQPARRHLRVEQPSLTRNHRVLTADGGRHRRSRGGWFAAPVGDGAGAQDEGPCCRMGNIG